MIRWIWTLRVSLKTPGHRGVWQCAYMYVSNGHTTAQRDRDFGTGNLLSEAQPPRLGVLTGPLDPTNQLPIHSRFASRCVMLELVRSRTTCCWDSEKSAKNQCYWIFTTECRVINVKDCNSWCPNIKVIAECQTRFCFENIRNRIIKSSFTMHKTCAFSDQKSARVSN